MAFKIIWSEQARDDLQAIVLFIAQDNPPVAESFGYLLMPKVDVLAQFLQIGRVVPEENDETVREIIFRSYRIIYKVLAEKEIVAIVRVWHGARGEPEIPSQLTF
ncbi:MAG: type II toxin-antitoxin system RelE/ParE family toxin [Limisphaerales bacterium]